MASSRNSRSTDSRGIVQTVLQALQPFVLSGQQVVVAYSGGLDSSVLLHAAKELQPKLNIVLSAYHVHHGLSRHADSWAKHCMSQCRDWEVPLTVVHVEVDRESAQGIEAAARLARYRALDSAAGDWIMLAHHRDDQAETLLLNLLRGSGMRGAGAMARHRGRYLRPLLGLSRAELEGYARATGLQWVDDESNSDTDFSRNFIRHRLLPLAEERFTGASAAVARAAAVFDESRGLLDDLARIDGGDVMPLSLESLRRLDWPRAANLLAYVLRRQGVAVPSRQWLSEALHQLLEAAEDRQPAITIGNLNLQLRRYAGSVWLVPQWPVPARRVWNGTGEVEWGEAKIVFSSTWGQGIARHRLDGPVTFQPRGGGERIRLAPNASSRPLKDLLREAGIPPWWRDRLPLMYCGEHLVWVPGIGVADIFRCSTEEDGIQLEFVGASW